MCRTHYNQHLRSSAERGGYPLGLIDTTEVAIHVEKLRAIGLGVNRISAISGVDRRTLCRDLKSGRMRGFTAKKILDIPLDWRLAADGARIANVGTQRRLQALVAIGYDYGTIGKHLGGLEASNLWKYASGNRKLVSAAFARRVEAVFHELQLQPRLDNSYATRRARANAESKGWAPPFAWDEGVIDDPTARPVKMKKQAGASDEDIEHLRSLGFTNREIAVDLGIKLESLERRFARAVA